MNNWRPYKLGDICSIKGGKRLPEGHQLTTVQTKYPYIRARDIRNGKISTSNLEFISEVTHNLISRYIVKTNDVCITIVANIGDAGIVTAELDNANLTENALRLTSFSKNVDPKFLCYVLSSKTYKSYCESLAAGAAQSKLGIYKVKTINLLLPPLPEQQRIASILSAYDDLIENNNKRIALLEQMAEQIYKEWFVRMRFPGYENAVFEKGVPKGWEIVPIGKLFSFYIGGGWGADYQSAEFSEAAYVIRGTDMPSVSKGSPNKEVLRFHKPSNLKSRKLKPFDIVFEVSGGSKDQWLGRNFMVTKELLDSYGGVVMCASFCKLIRPDIKKVSPYFIDQFLKLYYSTGLVSTFQVQSTGISNYQFESFVKYQTIIKPKDELLNKFSEIMSPIYSEINLLGRQQTILKQTRDLLLPRLISGKLRVKEVEKELQTEKSI